MSIDLINTAFSVIRAEKSERTSKNQSVLLDWRQEASRSTLAFLGLSSTDIEAANYWNGLFMSRDRTHQESLIQDSAPASLVWNGVDIPFVDIEMKSNSVAKAYAALKDEAKELSLELLALEDKAADAGTIAHNQKLDSVQSKLDGIKARLGRLQEELQSLTELKNHRKGKVVPSPVLRTGLSRVMLKYYSKAPASPHMLGYLATARARCKCSWEQLRLVAPAAALKQVKGRDVVQPCPTEVYAPFQARLDKLKGKKAFTFPPASRTGWSSSEILAYAWCMLINAYNRSWGAAGRVEYPKGFPIDRRFTQATAKSIKNRQANVAPKKELGEGESAIRELLKLVSAKTSHPTPASYREAIHKALTRSEVGPNAHSSDYTWLAIAMSRIVSVALSAQTYLESNRDPSALDVAQRVKHAEALFIFADSAAIIEDFGTSTIENAVKDWVVWYLLGDFPGLKDHYFNDMDGSDPQLPSYRDRAFIEQWYTKSHIAIGATATRRGHFSVEDEVIRYDLPVDSTVLPPADLAEVKAYGESKLATAEQLHQTLLDEYLGQNIDDIYADGFASESDNGVVEDEAEEHRRYKAAEEISHAECVSIPTLCSMEFCPKADALFNTAVEHPDFVEETPPVHEDQTNVIPSREEAWESKPDVPDYIEINGIVFQRVIENGATALNPNGSDFLAPSKNAFLCVYRYGRIYASSSSSVQMPIKGEDYHLSSRQIPVTVREAWAKEDPRRDLAEVRASVPTLSLRKIEPAPVSKATEAKPPKAGPSAKMTVEGLPHHLVVDVETGEEEWVLDEVKDDIVKAPAPAKGKGKEKSKPAPEPKKEDKKPKGKKSSAKEEPKDALSEFYAQFSETSGGSPSEKGSSIDGLGKNAWVAKYCTDVVQKGPKTQQAGCICTFYPCRHTKRDIAAKVISARDKSWNDAFLHVSGKTQDPPSKDKGKASAEPVEKKNPLRAKNAPRSSGLSSEQKASLRKFFKLPDELPADEFEKLSQAERNEIRSSGKLPRWAIALVLRDSKNLKKIISGHLDQEKAVEELKKAPPKARSAATEWSRLKARFDGILLLEKPRTGKQKALKSAFDKLVKEFPDNPALPKPRKGDAGKEEGPSDKKPKASPKQSSSSGDSISLDALKSIAAIAKLFRS